MSSDPRAQALALWLADVLSQPAPVALTPVSGDASFRRYFRAATAEGSVIAVDAPPAKEDCRPFVAIARALHAQGLCVPEVLAWSPEQGFMMLTDLGDTLLRSELTPQTVNTLYGAALSALFTLQSTPEPADFPLPAYDVPRLMTEMELFTTWFLPHYLGLTPTSDEAATLDQQFRALATACALQPKVFVHRDYHSRNLMLTPTGELGIIDFQDAVVGPITYDLASLLRDAYVVWPAADVRRWVADFHAEAGVTMPLPAFQQAFDEMAAQRHLKVLGIFARLSHRDGKHGYLADLPVVYRYLLDELADLPFYQPLHQLLSQWYPHFLAVSATTRT